MSDRIAFAPNRLVAPRAGRVSVALSKMWAAVNHAVELMGSRRQLLDMDDRMLHDLGISRAQAEFEATRAPWETRAARRRG